MDKRTFAQRCSDWVTEFCGSWFFVLVFSLGVMGWIVFNTIWLIFHQMFDPYPFIALNLVLTVVSTFQSPLIMMSQNRQIERDRESLVVILSELKELRKEHAEVLGKVVDIRPTKPIYSED